MVAGMGQSMAAGVCESGSCKTTEVYTIIDLKSLHAPKLDLTWPKVYNPPNSATSSGVQMFKYKKRKLKPYHCH